MRDTRKQDSRERAEPTLPLGGGAFSSPLAFRPSQKPKRNGAWPVALVLFAGAFMAASIVGMALLFQHQRADVAARASVGVHPTVLRAEPPSEPSAKLAPVPPASRLAKSAPAPSTASAEKTAALPAAGAAAVAQPRVQAMPSKAERREPVERRARKARASTAPQPKLPHTLSRDQVVAAMTKVTPAVNACFGDTHGKATVSFAVVGKTGRVVGARVTGKTGKVGSCIARSVRRARFPKFEKPRLEISYPFAR